MRKTLRKHGNGTARLYPLENATTPQKRQATYEEAANFKRGKDATNQTLWRPSKMRISLVNPRIVALWRLF